MEKEKFSEIMKNLYFECREVKEFTSAQLPEIVYMMGETYKILKTEFNKENQCPKCNNTNILILENGTTICRHCGNPR